jgi:site-specific DNA-methyltransferase (adenine-specific)
MLNTEEKEFKLLDPNLLIINEAIESIYGTPSNYDDIRDNIKSFGIIQPIIVNRSTLEVISGNIRLKIAIELGYNLVPVIYCELGVVDLMKLAISSNVYREKSLMDRYNEMNFIESYSKVTQGSRSDLDPQLMEDSELKKKLMLLIPTYTRNQINKSKKLLKDLNTENIEDKLVQDIEKIDKGVLSLNAYVNKLESDLETIRLNNNVPEFFEIHREGFTVYNDDSYSKPNRSDKSIATIVCSPAYKGMRDYGDDPTELGAEKTKEEYVKNLITHFNECHRLLKDDGSLFVNIGEGIEGKGYQGVVPLFVVEMLKTGLWTMNDEILWAKRNPVYTEGNRFVRSHEYIYQFVKSDTEGFKYNSNIYPFIKDEETKCVYGINGDHPKILSFLELRDNTFYTNVANTGKLRKLCRNVNLPMVHTATFPLSVPALLILLTTDEGDTVMDIFGGTNVTGEACILLERKYIGYEKYASYIAASEVRINNMAA